MKKGLWPVGSTVTLKDVEKKITIIGLGVTDADSNKEYDYIGVPYPEGFLGNKAMILFQHKEIEKVNFIGYMDTEYQKLYTKLEENE